MTDTRFAAALQACGVAASAAACSGDGSSFTCTTNFTNSDHTSTHRHRGELREFNGETDRVHLIVHYPPKVTLPNLINPLKGASTRRLRQEFPAQHLRGDLWPRPISPPPSAAPHHRLSSTTSTSKYAPTSADPGRQRQRTTTHRKRFPWP
ncbi:hypothetical protein GCM10029978_050700 [Actinoallomurus acanthiterrae]